MLKKFYPYEYVENVFLIDYELLYSKGIKNLIFDIDNTLVHHGDNATLEVELLFEKLHKMGFKTLLLTNNDEERVLRFIKNIDTLYICNARKPSIEGYLKAVKLLDVQKDEVVFIGEQIFTDICGANNCGMKSILVKFIRLDEEKRIGKKRYIEKIILKLYKRSCYCNRLGYIQKRGEKNVLESR